MAYQKHTWASGETITDELLNHMEQGIADADAKQGTKGDPGEPGKNGVTPNITLTVSKLAAGSNPTVQKGGTTEAPTFAIGIPEGAKGANGTPGANGADGKSIKSIVINVKGTAVSGEATLSDGSTKVPITGTYSAS